MYGCVYRDFFSKRRCRKNNCSCFFGSAIASFGKKVLLVDGNISSPNLGLHLEVVEPEFSLQDVLEKKANPSQAVHKLDNFDILPASIFRDDKVKSFISKTKNKSSKKKL